MNTSTRRLLHTLIVPLTLVTAGFSSSVFAGGAAGSIVYAPGAIPPGALLPATAVPALGGGALIVLAILLAVVAVRVLPSSQHAHKWIVTLTTTAAIASGVGGIDLISDAYADSEVNFTEDAGGSVDLECEDSVVINATNVPQQIEEITVSSFAEVGSVPDQCTVGLTLNKGPEEGSSCNFILRCE